jgi:hypothetical protein
MNAPIISDGRLNDRVPNATNENIQICNIIIVINVIMQQRYTDILAGTPEVLVPILFPAKMFACT